MPGNTNCYTKCDYKCNYYHLARVARDWPLQPLVVVDDRQVGILLLDALLHLRLQLVHPDRGPLTVQGTAEWRRECQAEAAEERLDRCIRPREALQDALLLQEGGQDGREQHARCGHTDAAQHHRSDPVRGCRLGHAHLLVVLVKQLHTLLQFPGKNRQLLATVTLLLLLCCLLTGSSSSGCWCNWQRPQRPVAPNDRPMGERPCTAGSGRGQWPGHLQSPSSRTWLVDCKAIWDDYSNSLYIEFITLIPTCCWSGTFPSGW